MIQLGWPKLQQTWFCFVYLCSTAVCWCLHVDSAASTAAYGIVQACLAAVMSTSCAVMLSLAQPTAYADCMVCCLACFLQVRSRMESESGISFTEFTYQLLQGYDFVHLARNHGVRMQVSTLHSTMCIAVAAWPTVHSHVYRPGLCRAPCNNVKQARQKLHVM